MPCKFVDGKIKKVPELGNDAEFTVWKCKLKASVDINTLTDMCAMHKAIGLGGSIVSTVCPVAEGNQWGSCPWHRGK